MRKLYWLDDEAWARIEPHLPRGRRGARRVDDHRVISGIVHMLQSGARWRDWIAGARWRSRRHLEPRNAFPGASRG